MGSVIPLKKSANSAYLELKNLLSKKLDKVESVIENKLKRMGKKIDFFHIFKEPDHNFPNGIPNPLLIENQGVTSQAVLQNKADLGP